MLSSVGDFVRYFEGVRRRLRAGRYTCTFFCSLRTLPLGRSCQIVAAVRQPTRGGLIAVTLAAILFCISPVRGQQAAVNYVYDELGRLTAVIDQQGDVAVYNYDAVGNLLSIQRINATDQPGSVAISLGYPSRPRVV